MPTRVDWARKCLVPFTGGGCARRPGSLVGQVYQLQEEAQCTRGSTTSSPSPVGSEDTRSLEKLATWNGRDPPVLRSCFTLVLVRGITYRTVPFTKYIQYRACTYCTALSRCLPRLEKDVGVHSPEGVGCRGRRCSGSPGSEHLVRAVQCSLPCCWLQRVVSAPVIHAHAFAREEKEKKKEARRRICNACVPAPGVVGRAACVGRYCT